MPDIILGVDPGVTGALAAFFDKELLYLEDLPNIEEIKIRKGSAVRDIIGGPKHKVTHHLNVPAMIDLIRNIIRGRQATLLVEHVHPRPGQGSLSTARLMKVAGEIRGVAVALGMDYREVDPAKWKLETGTPKAKPDACKHAERLFPAWADKFRRTSIDHNKAEAALIGFWGTMHLE